MRVRLTCKPIAPWIGSRTDDVACHIYNGDTGKTMDFTFNGRTNEEAIGRAILNLSSWNLDPVTVFEIQLLTGDSDG